MSDMAEIADVDVSPDFVWDAEDARIARELVAREGTPQAIRYFARHTRRLSNYGYWFLLGTLWVRYTGFSDLETWRRLFRSERPRRASSLMKPSELRELQNLADPLTLYRAHRLGENDWIAYTLDLSVAQRLARSRQGPICAYRVAKADVIALFLRRGEQEVLVLDAAHVQRVEAED